MRPESLAGLLVAAAAGSRACVSDELSLRPEIGAVVLEGEDIVCGRHGGTLLVVISEPMPEEYGSGVLFSVFDHPDLRSTAWTVDHLPPSRLLATGLCRVGPTSVIVTGDPRGVLLHRLEVDEISLAPPRHLSVPEQTSDLVVDFGKRRHWEPAVRTYVDECLLGATGPRAHDFVTRGPGSLCLDVLTALTRGGVYLRPRDTRVPKRVGRALSAYSYLPLAYLIEGAGGGASSGRGPLLALPITSFEQQAPVAFGAAYDIDRLEQHHREQDAAQELTPVEYNTSLFRARSIYRAGR